VITVHKVSNLWFHCSGGTTLCLKKTGTPDIFDCNFKTNCQILIILARIFRTQLAIKWLFSFPPHSTFVSALPGENTTSKISFLSDAIWLLN